MKLSLAQRQHLKRMLHDRCRDWAGVHAALKQQGYTISQSSIDRFIAGKSDAPRTLVSFAKVLGTSPENLVRDLHLAASSPLVSVPPFALSTDTVSAASAAKSARILRDPDAFRVAYQLWVEMGTRKLGEPIDPATDLIHEIYDSWYAFFKTARELAKAIPFHKDPADPALRRLVQLSQAVLNHGLRSGLGGVIAPISNLEPMTIGCGILRSVCIC